MLSQPQKKLEKNEVYGVQQSLYKQYIMTAAHCIPENKPSNIIAMLGVHKIDERWEEEGDGKEQLRIQSYKIDKNMMESSMTLHC